MVFPMVNPCTGPLLRNTLAVFPVFLEGFLSCLLLLQTQTRFLSFLVIPFFFFLSFLLALLLSSCSFLLSALLPASSFCLFLLCFWFLASDFTPDHLLPVNKWTWKARHRRQANRYDYLVQAAGPRRTCPNPAPNCGRGLGSTEGASEAA